MKIKDIKEFELGKHCFGKILKVNGIDYEDITKTEMIEFIIDMFNNDINSSQLIEETFINCLQHLQYDCTETEESTCDQCGSYNYSNKYMK